METDMTDRAQDPIFKQSTCPHNWDIRDNPSSHQNLFLQRWGPVVGGNLEEAYSVNKASALLAHHLASSIFTWRNQVLSAHSWSCSRIAWRAEQSCDLQDICLSVGKDCKIKLSSYNRRFNQRNGEGSQSKFLKLNSWVINKYSSVWAEVPSITPTAHSRLLCDALRLWPHNSIPLQHLPCIPQGASSPWRGGRTEHREGNPTSQPGHKGLLPRCVHQMTEGQKSKSGAKLTKCSDKIVCIEQTKGGV